MESDRRKVYVEVNVTRRLMGRLVRISSSLRMMKI